MLFFSRVDDYGTKCKGNRESGFYHVCIAPASPPISDSRAQKILQEKLKIENSTVLQTFSKTARDNALRILKDAGLSVRQIERLTGISRGIVLKV